jgi:hypothetical protein
MEQRTLIIAGVAIVCTLALIICILIAQLKSKRTKASNQTKTIQPESQDTYMEEHVDDEDLETSIKTSITNQNSNQEDISPPLGSGRRWTPIT